MPREETNIVIRPRGGLSVAKVGLVDVIAAIHVSAGTTKEAGHSDTFCLNAEQNIVVISAPKEEHACRYEEITVSETARDSDVSIVNERNPLALGANRIGTTTTIIVACSGTKTHRIGHRKDVSPLPTDRISRRCREQNPREDHQCSPKCKLCGGKHLAAYSECKARYKITYVVRKRQWERRKIDSLLRQLSASRELPPRITRNREQAVNGTAVTLVNNAERSPSRDRVSWADTVRCPNAMKSRDASVDRKKQRTRSQETETLEALRKENAEMKATIVQLTREMTNIRKENNNKKQPMEQAPTAPSTVAPSISQAATKELDSAKEPAPEKTAIEMQGGTKTASDLDARFSGIDSGLDKLEKLILAMKTTIERKFVEYDSILAVQERNIQLMMSHPIFGQQQRAPKS
ncbi:hypothetical protein HPB49_017185 [Dermacentor silvarum]|uniref:Uncharacterized protein n=1 Tax=Dermacentor silvarum TaxID=543639 RepID=A0ACB8C4M7_DERSI|nr:hypothetical protein HPB49_017185 [Dermacentor silvarum]